MNRDRKIKKAVALRYQPEYQAPKVVSKGKGIIAEKIVENAQQHRIPIHKDEQLVDALEKLKLYSQIPPELYEVVAKLLATIEYIDRKKGEKIEE
ncbi:MAG: EscU/YscU/HrcU family type III secretion system export apparatus switch protein [Clostridia bacterium]|nr:EscU/YscU/HrcU family type III secretion system export apparatus switch protein [Clostridia bacterium]